MQKHLAQLAVIVVLKVSVQEPSVLKIGGGGGVSSHDTARLVSLHLHG